MVVDPTQAVPFLQWIGRALFFWAVTIGVLSVAALFVGWLVGTLRRGPVAGAVGVGQTIAAIVPDFLLMSPRRVLALSWLTIKEAIRRKVVIVFGVFLVLLLFAGWFLDPGSTDPARLYLSFVFDWPCFLILLLALFLSSLSLPADIRSRTIHTVLTKPVRQSEIVLGRMLGFTAVGSGLLLLMAGMSLIFVYRGLAHRHDIEPADIERAEKQLAKGGDEAAAPLMLRTTLVHKHRHRLQIDPNQVPPEADGVRRGTVQTEMEQGHWHEVQYEIRPAADGRPPQLICKVGPPEGMLVARVKVGGKLQFKDRGGKDAEKGLNVGDEWTYRGYIEGGTLGAAVWTFSDLHEQNFPDGLPVEMTIGVFRTYKGNIEKGVTGSLTVRNPRTGQSAQEIIFPSKEFVVDTHFIPRELQTPEGKPIDLFRDLVDDGRLEIRLRCVDAHQYFGAAQDDLYLRAYDNPFALNFLKGYLGIWLQLLLVVGLGVMFSTFLSGPIATLATVGALVGAWFSDFIFALASHKQLGGGPVESFVRLITQQNMVTEMPEGLQNTVMKIIDGGLEQLLGVIWAVLPNFGQFSFTEYVASGFDVPGDLVLKSVCQALAFCVPLFVLGSLFLKTREVAQ